MCKRSKHTAYAEVSDYHFSADGTMLVTAGAVKYFVSKSIVFTDQEQNLLGLLVYISYLHEDYISHFIIVVDVKSLLWKTLRSSDRTLWRAPYGGE